MGQASSYKKFGEEAPPNQSQTNQPPPGANQQPNNYPPNQEPNPNRSQTNLPPPPLAPPNQPQFNAQGQP